MEEQITEQIQIVTETETSLHGDQGMEEEELATLHIIDEIANVKEEEIHEIEVPEAIIETVDVIDLPLKAQTRKNLDNNESDDEETNDEESEEEHEVLEEKDCDWLPPQARQRKTRSSTKSKFILRKAQDEPSPEPSTSLGSSLKYPIKRERGLSFMERMNSSSKLYSMNKNKAHGVDLYINHKPGRPPKSAATSFKVVSTPNGPEVRRRLGRPTQSEMRSRLTLDDLKELEERKQEGTLPVQYSHLMPSKKEDIQADVKGAKVIKYTLDKGLVVDFPDESVSYGQLVAAKLQSEAAMDFDQEEKAAAGLPSTSQIKTEPGSAVSVEDRIDPKERRQIEAKLQERKKEYAKVIHRYEKRNPLLDNFPEKFDKPCLVCKIRLGSDGSHSDISHKMEHSPENKVCSCPVCGVHFTSLDIMNIHAAMHNGLPRQLINMDCSLCKSIYPGSSPMMGITTRVRVMNAHVESQHGGVPAKFKCPVCQQTFKEESLLKYHIELHAPDIEDCICDLPKCITCKGSEQIIKQFSSREFDKALDFTSHQQLQEKFEKTRVACCEICKLRVIDLKVHQEREHNPEEAPLHPFMCNVCRVTFPTQRLAELHVKVHSCTTIAVPTCSNGAFQCSICDSRIDSIYYHVLTMHRFSPPQFRCYVCGVTYPEKTLYLMHLNLHLPVNCTCNQKTCYSCTSKQELHDFTDFTSEEDFLYGNTQCEICQLLVRDIRQHRREHSEKIYRCSICNVNFRSKHMASFHLAIHTRSRNKIPLTCSLCGTARAQSLYTHVVMRHKDVSRPYQCRVCQLKFPVYNLYLVHCESHYPDTCNCGCPTCDNCVSQQMGKAIRLKEPPSIVVKKEGGEEGGGESPMAVISNVTTLSAKKKQKQPHYEKLILDDYEDPSEKMDPCVVCMVNVIDHKEHMLCHQASKAKFRCKVCKVTFERAEMTAMHSTIHSLRPAPKVTHKCEHCPLVITPNNKALLRHTVTHHYDLEQSHECFVCYDCFPDNNSLQAHLHMHYPVACTCEHQHCRYCRYYSCYICEKSFKKSQQFTFKNHLANCRGPSRKREAASTAESTAAKHPHLQQPSIPKTSEENPIIVKEENDASEVEGRKVKITDPIVIENEGDEGRIPASVSATWKRGKIPSVSDKLNAGFLNWSSKRKNVNKSTSSKGVEEAQVIEDNEDDCKVDENTSIPSASATASKESRQQVARISPFKPDRDVDTNIIHSSGDEDNQDSVLVSDNDEETECTACGELVKSGSIVSHFQQHHSRRRSHDCHTCRATFKLRDQLLSHKLSHTNPNRRVCALCHLHFTDASSWQQHQSVAHGHQLLCLVCLEPFGYISSLKHHRRLYVSAAPRAYPCNSCCVSFHDAVSLKEHKRMHDGECRCGDCQRCHKYKCRCGQLFKAHEFLLYRLHTMQCLKCYMCSSVFDTEELLAMHERRHYFRCAVCGVMFRYARDLHRHETGHNCRCPADDSKCLTCRKAWCMVCRTRFLPDELTSYKEHRSVCRGSELICLCREDDCLLCSKHRCAGCGQTFAKYKFASFSMHRRRCSGKQVELDPFLRVKAEQPVEVDLTQPRRRPNTAQPTIDLDSDDEDNTASQPATPVSIEPDNSSCSTPVPIETTVATDTPTDTPIAIDIDAGDSRSTPTLLETDRPLETPSPITIATTVAMDTATPIDLADSDSRSTPGLLESTQPMEKNPTTGMMGVVAGIMDTSNMEDNLNLTSDDSLTDNPNYGLRDSMEPMDSPLPAIAEAGGPEEPSPATTEGGERLVLPTPITIQPLDDDCPTGASQDKDQSEPDWVRERRLQT